MATTSKIKILLLSLLVTTTFSLSAQKLPGKQEGSMRAPQKVKIDGKATEWTFKAYNEATDVFYTIANDDNNLYLTIKAEQEGVIRKILRLGIKFSVNVTGKKWNENTLSVSYPVFNYKTRPYINLKDKPTGTGIDSFILANNKRFDLQSKNIRTAGFAGLDTLISVYNADGVRAAASFDGKMNYTYELAISLTHLKQILTTDGKFFYKVTLNAIGLDDVPGVNIVRDASGAVQTINIVKRDALPNSGSMSADTDFSDEYVLSR